MSQDTAANARRTISESASIPRAPPLPASRPFQRARDAANRIFGYPSRPPSAESNYADAERFARGSISARKASLGATEDGSTSHRTGLEINTLSINERGTHALLGGKELFKTVRIEDSEDGPKCVEELNLKTAIKSNPTQASGQPRQIFEINIADVAWAKGDCGDFVAAATSSGKIILYDLGHAGLPAAQLYEHSRQVHRVTFNPHRGSFLLSGSQDGSVRLWDLRQIRREAKTLQSKHKYSGQSDGVRDVKWSPTDGVDFAFGTDGGWIQCWDIRYLKNAKIKIPAHARACNSVDWHPDGKHLASAGTDQTVKIWDFSSNRPRKANWQVKTPYPLMNARWRPSCESLMQGDNGARLCTQIVTSYSREHPEMHVWDLRRPDLPFREMIPYSSAPTDLLWHSQDLIWTVGREGVFSQTDVMHTAKVIDKRNLQTVAISPDDEITFFSQRRKVSKRVPPTRRQSSIAELERLTKSVSTSPETSFLSRSWGDDSIDHSFLKAMGPRPRRKSSARSTTLSVSITPANPEVTAPQIKLDDVLLNRKSFRPQQNAVRGSLPGGISPLVFEYLAQNYELEYLSNRRNSSVLEKVRQTLQNNAEYSFNAHLYRLSQAWKVIEFSVSRYLEHRAEHRRKAYVDGKSLNLRRLTESFTKTLVQKLLAEQNKATLQSPSSMKPVSFLTQQLHAPESSSNTATPTTRPLYNGKPHLPDPDVGEKLALPPSITQYRSPSPGAVSERPVAGRKLTSSNLDLHKMHANGDTTSRIDMVHKWSTQQRSPLALDPIDADGAKLIPKLEKHDSEESFPFLAGSTGSRGPSLPGSFTSGESAGMVAERPSRPVLRLNGMGLSDGQLDDREQGKRIGDRDNRMNVAAPTAGHFAPSNPAIPPEPAPTKVPSSQPVARSHLPQRTLGPSLKDADGNWTHKDTVYLPDDHEPDLEKGRPLVLVEMVHELIRYYTTDLPNAQMLSHLTMLVGPLLPRTHPLPSATAEAVLSHYIDAFSGLGYSPIEMPQLLHQSFDHLIRTGLNPLQLEGIISTYHDQLVPAGALVEAAVLRKATYPHFPAVYEDAIKDNFMHFKCGSCGKPMQDGVPRLRCEECKEKLKACPICWMERSPFESSAKDSHILTNANGGTRSTLLSACLLCGHGGHAACLRMWFVQSKESEGACPNSGCLCDCTIGLWRQTKLEDAHNRRKAVEQGRNNAQAHMRVKSDEWKVRESKAAMRASAALGTAAKGRSA